MRSPAPRSSLAAPPRFYYNVEPKEPANYLAQILINTRHEHEVTSLIVKLRKEGEQKLGAKFDIRDFHDVVLRDGVLPLELLDEQGEKYANAK